MRNIKLRNILRLLISPLGGWIFAFFPVFDTKIWLDAPYYYRVCLLFGSKNFWTCQSATTMPVGHNDFDERFR